MEEMDRIRADTDEAGEGEYLWRSKQKVQIGTCCWN